MATNKQFGVNIDLDLNQLLNTRAENGTGFITGGTPSKGRFMFDTATSRLIYDDGVNVETIANLNDVAGLLDFKGSYDATTNTPDLVSGTGISKGDYYVVTVAGSFYGTQLEVGDSLFANVDTPIVITDWTIVQGNIVPASETVQGVVELATQAETNTGTDDQRVITPLKLKNANYLPHKFTSGSLTVGGGTPTTVTHNLGNSKPTFTIIRDSTNAEVVLSVDNFTANSFDITKLGASYNVTVTVIG